MNSPRPLSLYPMVGVWKALQFRSDVDNIVLELLGHFALEKVYTDDPELITTLCAQLNAIFYMQRMSLPSESRRLNGQYPTFLATWEVTLRSVEFILQLVLERRENLPGVLIEKFLPEMLLSSLRFLTLHPKPPPRQNCRERFARIHSLLENVQDSCSKSDPFLLLVCKEITNRLRNDHNALALPPRLDFPNLTSELYPLSNVLSPGSVYTIFSQDSYMRDWLSEILILRDIAQFVVGSFVQYEVNKETRNVRLQECAAETRNAILNVAEHLQMPRQFLKQDWMRMFSETFRIVLPDTPMFVRRGSFETQNEQFEVEALNTLSARLDDRRLIERVSDQETTRSISEVTRKIALLDDPTGQSRASYPRLYALNCSKCHIVGDSQLRYSGKVMFPSGPDVGAEINLLPQSKCIHCGESITLAREILLAGQVWRLLKPLECNADTINAERHLRADFQAMPLKLDVGVSGTVGIGISYNSQFSVPGFNSGMQSDSIGDERKFSISNVSLYEAPVGSPIPRNPGAESQYSPFIPSKLHSNGGGRTSLFPKFMKMSKSRRGSIQTLGDSSSRSSNIESQKPEEISLKGLINPNSSTKKFANKVCVSLSGNSTYAIFWAQVSIHLWDIGTSPPTPKGKGVYLTDSICILAAVSKAWLSYVIKTPDRRLKVRIINLLYETAPVVEYSIPSSPWCTNISICPKEKYVALGCDDSTIRIFNTMKGEEPVESRLHYTDSSQIETLSFSSDGTILLASTRHPRSGLIRVYYSKSPFIQFHEIESCRYGVKLHESEDGGVTSAIFRSSPRAGENLICISTWTQSGTPILVQPESGVKSAVQVEPSRSSDKLGSRIQCASFSPSGKDLMMVNNKGHLYQITNLNSSPMSIKRIATTKEIRMKSEPFAMAFMTFPPPDFETVVLAWADLSKCMAYIKKVLVTSNDGHVATLSPVSPKTNPIELPSAEIQLPRIELAGKEIRRN